MEMELHVKVYQIKKNMISIELKSHFIRLYQMALSDGNFDKTI